jgi:hypothetical protein
MTNEGIKTQVTICVSATCASCKRVLSFTENDLTEHSLITGNASQRASYHLEALTTRLLADIAHRTWDKTEAGWRCAHCRAGDLDKLAQEVDPIPEISF